MLGYKDTRLEVGHLWLTTLKQQQPYPAYEASARALSAYGEILTIGLIREGFDRLVRESGLTLGAVASKKRQVGPSPLQALEGWHG